MESCIRIMDISDITSIFFISIEKVIVKQYNNLEIKHKVIA